MSFFKRNKKQDIVTELDNTVDASFIIQPKPIPLSSVILKPEVTLISDSYLKEIKHLKKQMWKFYKK